MRSASLHAQPAEAEHAATLQATSPQNFALFGYVGDMGRFRLDAGDLAPFDDFITAAINEDED